MGFGMKKALPVLAVTGLMGLGLLAVTKPTLAHAGTNGQQINFCANGSDYKYVFFEGYNQNGEHQQDGYHVNLHPGECKLIAHWYFVGDVQIQWQDSESMGLKDQTTTCLIPREYNEDSYTCMPKAVQ